MPEAAKTDTSVAEEPKGAVLSHRHEAIIDWMLCFPNRNQNECAKDLGYTPTWLSQVIHQDAFRAQLAKRRSEYNAELHEQTVARLYTVAEKAITNIIDELESDECDPNFALDAKDKALKHLGYGSNRAAHLGVAGQSTQVNVFLTDKATLAQARERMGGNGVVSEPEQAQLPAEAGSSVPALIEGQVVDGEKKALSNTGGS